MGSGLENLKIAVVADWLTDRGGAERVVLALASLFPQADIFTSVFREAHFPELTRRTVYVSFLNRLPLAVKHQLFSLWRPLAFEEFDFKDYDIVISSSSAESKGVITKPETFHLSYCHTPTRYFWSHYEEYLARPQLGFFNPWARLVLPRLIGRLRRQDRLAAQRVDQFVANSRTTQGRIEQYYGRRAKVIYPPVETKRFSFSRDPGSYYLVVGRQVPYKRTEIAVAAFNHLGLPLLIVGQGPEVGRLRPLARRNIEFHPFASDLEVARFVSRAQALIFPQVEDFGIVALEAQAAGRPVIAFRGGGALETVIDGVTGLFFDEQTPDALVKAVRSFKRMRWQSQRIRQHALSFDTAVFKRRFARFLKSAYIRYRLEMGLTPKI